MRGGAHRRTEFEHPEREKLALIGENGLAKTKCRRLCVCNPVSSGKCHHTGRWPAVSVQILSGIRVIVSGCAGSSICTVARENVSVETAEETDCESGLGSRNRRGLS